MAFGNPGLLGALAPSPAVAAHSGEPESAMAPTKEGKRVVARTTRKLRTVTNSTVQVGER